MFTIHSPCNFNMSLLKLPESKSVFSKMSTLMEYHFKSKKQSLTVWLWIKTLVSHRESVILFNYHPNLPLMLCYIKGFLLSFLSWNWSFGNGPQSQAADWSKLTVTPRRLDWTTFILMTWCYSLRCRPSQRVLLIQRVISGICCRLATEGA